MAKLGAATWVSGLKISTRRDPLAEFQGQSWTWETAVCDQRGAHPVERYSNGEEARLGHARWIEQAATLTSILKLGHTYYNVPDTPYTLWRYPEGSVPDGTD